MSLQIYANPDFHRAHELSDYKVSSLFCKKYFLGRPMYIAGFLTNVADS